MKHYYCSKPFSGIISTAVFLAMFILSGCEYPGESNQQPNSHSTGPEHGYLIAAGGSLKDTAVFEKFMELAGGPYAPVVFVSTARTDGELTDESFYKSQEKRFSGYGFENFSFLHTRDREVADSKAFVEPIQNASAVWFLGGRQDPDKLVQILRP